MKEPELINQILKRIISGGTVSSTAKAEPDDTEINRDVRLTRKINQGISTTSLSASPKNAIVVEDGPIQPPQALTDVGLRIILGGLAQSEIADEGITYIDPALAQSILIAGDGNWQGNSLGSENVNAILALIALNVLENGIGGYSSLIINLTGSGAPTGQGLTDKTFLEGEGFTITTS